MNEVWILYEEVPYHGKQVHSVYQTEETALIRRSELETRAILNNWNEVDGYWIEHFTISD